MAGITLQAELYMLEDRIFSVVVEAFIRQEMQKAVKEFLKACLVRIPQRTGFLRGSFTDIARYFKAEGTGAGQGGYATKPEYYYISKGNRILKTPRSGIKFATPPNQVLRRQGGGVIFELDADIKYFAANDFTVNVRGTPWNSIKEGLSAMVTYLEGAPNRFPNLESLMTTVYIRSENGRTSRSQKSPDPSSIIATRELLIQGFD